MPTIARDPVSPTTRAMLHNAARASAVGIGKPFRGLVRNGRIYYGRGYAFLMGSLGDSPYFRSSYIVSMLEMGADVSDRGELLVLVETRNSAYMAWISERDYLDYLDKKIEGGIRVED
jgi:hypothetical protein